MDSDDTCSSNRPADIRRKEESAPLIGELRPIHPPSVDGRAGCETWSVEFSPDGSYFAWSKGYGIVQLLLWPLQGIEWHGTPQFTAAAKERTLDCGQTIWGLAFGPRASSYAARSGDQLRRTSLETAQPLLLATGLCNGEIKVWEVETGRLCFNLRGHQSIVRDLVFAPNGSLTLVSGSRDTTLRIWNLKKSDNSQVLKGHTDWVYSLSVSPDCSMIASVCRRNPKVFLWSLRSYTFIRHLQNGNTWQVSCDFSPDGALLATAAYLANWETSLWDPYTGEHLFRLQECFSCNFPIMDNPIRAVRFSSDGLHLAFITMDREIRVWEIGQDEPLIESERRHFSCGLCCTFHPQGGVVATGTRDGHVKFWNVPQAVPSLVHFCRMALRFSVSTHQVLALPIPGKIKDILTYRNYEEHYDLLCSYHRCRQ